MLSGGGEHGEQLDVKKKNFEHIMRVGDLVRITFCPMVKIAGKTHFCEFCKCYNSTKVFPTREIF